MDKILVQLGRSGDILNILPLCQMDAARGLKVGLMVAKDFAPLLEGVSYVEPIVFQGHMMQLAKATKEAEAMCKQVVVTQLVGPYTEVKNVVESKGELKYATHTESFIKDAWALAGRLADWRIQPALAFDRRQPKREAALLAKLPEDIQGSERLILVAADGVSSPFPFKKLLMVLLRRGLGARYDVLDLGTIRAERFFDLLGLYERARCLVATDSAPLHLAYAVPSLPVIALTQDKPALWNGSPWRAQHLRHIRYGDFEDRCEEILDAIKGLGKNGSYFSMGDSPITRTYHVWSRYDGDWTGNETWPGMLDMQVEVGAIGRDSVVVLNDTKRFPFVKDVLRIGTTRARDNDVIVLTRNDALLPKGVWPNCPWSEGSRPELGWNIPGFAHRIQNGSWHPACDLFVFTKKWWEDNKKNYPDFVMGRDWMWHRALKELMLMTGGKELAFEVTAVVSKKVAAPKKKDAPPAKYLLHNRKLWDKFAKKNNIQFTYPSVEKQVDTVLLQWQSLKPYAYNPGLVRQDNRLLMVYRHHFDNTASTRLRIAELDGQYAVLSDKPITIPDSGVSVEDAKFFTRRGQLWLSWVDSRWTGTTTIAEAKSVVKYGQLVEGDEWTVQHVTQPQYGKNDYSCMMKNWVFFGYEETIYCIYQSSPEQIILQFDGSQPDNPVALQELRTEGPKWKWGQIKGGTAPVPFQGKLLRFFHSTLDNEPPPWQRRYYLGAMVIEPSAPFRPVEVSNSPIVRGSEFCDLTDLARANCFHFKGNVVFPGGCVPEGDGWLVSCGINDSRCAILKLTEKDLNL